jgi:hypothetical protein
VIERHGTEGYERTDGLGEQSKCKDDEKQNKHHLVFVKVLVFLFVLL